MISHTDIMAIYFLKLNEPVEKPVFSEGYQGQGELFNEAEETITYTRKKTRRPNNSLAYPCIAKKLYLRILV